MNLRDLLYIFMYNKYNCLTLPSLLCHKNILIKVYKMVEAPAMGNGLETVLRSLRGRRKKIDHRTGVPHIC